MTGMPEDSSAPYWKLLVITLFFKEEKFYLAFNASSNLQDRMGFTQNPYSYSYINTFLMK